MINPLDPKSLAPARKALGLTRGKLAELSGIHETTILRIEKGEVDPKLDGTWLPLVRVLTARAAQSAPAEAA